MLPDRRQRLEDIGFEWDILTKAWEDGFSKLLQFKEAEKHCIVPKGFKLKGFNLGLWVSNQRKAKDSMLPDRRQRLDDIGFEWDILTKAWEDGFSKLLQFKKAEGHCIVPTGFVLEGFNLGSWVSNQRKARRSMSHKRKERLNALGFVWNALKRKT